jgi:hypothetical protein
MSNYCSIHPCPAGIPPEDPERLQGPEVGQLVWYEGYGKYIPAQVCRVVERSYVWGPGDHNFRNADGTFGMRRYDWKVVDFGKSRLVVDDKDLTIIEPGMKMADPSVKAGAE